MKFDEMKCLVDESGIDIPKLCESTPGDDTVDGYQLENSVVQNISCNPQQPLCLYDFTIKHVMTDFIAYTVPNLFDFENKDYFYEKDYNMIQNRKTHDISLKKNQSLMDK